MLKSPRAIGITAMRRERRTEFYETHFINNHAVFSQSLRVWVNDIVGSLCVNIPDRTPYRRMRLPFFGRNILPALIAIPV
jgi:hypothetical protein